MLTVKVPMSAEKFDEDTNEFVEGDTFELRLEHSLVSLSKWESFFEKPFITDDDKTSEETVWYVQAMTLDPDIPPEVFQNLTSENFDTINAYINSKQTASWVNVKKDGRPSHEKITAELIYYWMIALNIPVEFQHWHLSRLLMLIKICNHKNTPPKKMSPREMARERHRVNAERKARYGTTG